IVALKQQLSNKINVIAPPEGTAQNTLYELESYSHKDWDFDALPEHVQIGDNLVLLRYPALVDEKDSVAIRLFARQSKANRMHREGLLRLYKLRSSQQRRMLAKRFSRFFTKHALITFHDSSSLIKHSLNACYRAAFAVQLNAVRTREDFEMTLNIGKQTIIQKGEQLESLLENLFNARLKIRRKLETVTDVSLDYLVTDIKQQLDLLFAESFLEETPWDWLMQYPRYLEAVEKRLEKIPYPGPRDRKSSEELQDLWCRYQRLCDGGHTDKEEAIDRIRWMIEEYRVSLFAQSLGTRIPVSANRFEKALTALDS
ncbi:MAG: DUF3418 domain-containing protein, partial [Gammaproteobacteria bacterium]|nr:DUF3418 domain-containing protein [Gammaproteobacteria bacterium]